MRAIPALLAAVTAGLVLGFPNRQAPRAAVPADNATRLELTSLHTGETVSVALPDRGQMPAATLDKLQQVLRDHRTHEQHEMDPALFGLLVELARACGCEPKYAVISGYRSPATNAQLRADGHQVAERSLHMEGRAVDVRLVGCSLSRLHEAALAAKRGGVGYYPRSNFVHVDTGRVRSWEE